MYRLQYVYILACVSSIKWLRATVYQMEYRTLAGMLGLCRILFYPSFLKLAIHHVLIYSVSFAIGSEIWLSSEVGHRLNLYSQWVHILERDK